MQRSITNNKAFLPVAGIIIAAIILTIFYVINAKTFFLSDDYCLGQTQRFAELPQTAYNNWLKMNGRVFGITTDIIFYGIFKDKTIFNIANTIIFALFVWLICKISAFEVKIDSAKNKVYLFLIVLLFAWFLLPAPTDTLFWLTGAGVHLWTATYYLLFLLVYFRFRQQQSPLPIQLFLFCLGACLIGHEMGGLPLCGGLLVYYCIHIKKFKSNDAFLVIGLIVGTLFSVLAPGNFVRLHGSEAMMHPTVYEIIRFSLTSLLKYKALWAFLLILGITYYKDKKTAKLFIAQNQVLLYTLLWSVIAFSIVFRPPTRAMFFGETIALLLHTKLLLFITKQSNFALQVYRKQSVLLTSLLLLFAIDCSILFPELLKQNKTHEELIAELKANNGDVCIDYVPHYHRMVCSIVFDTWTYEQMCKKYNVSKIKKTPKWLCMISDGSMFSEEYRVATIGIDGKKIPIYQLGEILVIKTRHNLHGKKIIFNYKQAIYKLFPIIKTSKRFCVQLDDSFLIDANNLTDFTYAITVGTRVCPATITSVFIE